MICGEDMISNQLTDLGVFVVHKTDLYVEYIRNIISYYGSSSIWKRKNTAFQV